MPKTLTRQQKSLQELLQSWKGWQRTVKNLFLQQISWVLLASFLFGACNLPSKISLETPALPESTTAPTATPTDLVLSAVPSTPEPSDAGQVAAPSTNFFPFIGKRSPSRTFGADWATLAANPERTSWTPEEVPGNLKVDWYRPIQAYIPQNVQIIAANDLIYVSTSRGLYALNAATGDVAWRFDTELPLGNSPTVARGVLYVGGFDRKIHALDAFSGAHLWSFDGAQAGFSTNPLVVDGRIIAGSRDGNMYAIGAQGTLKAGQLLWKFQTGGPINISAAYKDGVVYFASNDNYAYGLKADTGAQVWKSQKLPGDGYNYSWAVIFQDKVIFMASTGYRHELNPGVGTLKDPEGQPYISINRVQRDDIFFDKLPSGTIGPEISTSDPWAGANDVMDASRISEYLEDNPNPDPHLHKPWRRVMIVLNRADGIEYTTDFDGDGYPEYAPIAVWASRSGSNYPPIVGPDAVLYHNNVFTVEDGRQRGKVLGWKFGTPYLSIIGGEGALDEPQAISAGGNMIYRSICCDRVGDGFTMQSPTTYRTYWDYSNKLSEKASGYDEMWWGIEQNTLPRLRGNYGNQNGIYHNHGDQNPFIPYAGRLYIHRSNAIIALGSGDGPGKLPLLEINAAQDTVTAPSAEQLKSRLGAEIQKMIAAGHLRPGYYNAGQFSQLKNMNDYFSNPGDTLYTLARAYPYLSPALQQQTRDYLKREYQAYFADKLYAQTGWSDGAAREAMPIPPEVAAKMAEIGKTEWPGEPWSWPYPPQNFYAMWKYAQIFPNEAGAVYEQAKKKLQVPVPNASDDYLKEFVWEHNAYIAGYIGFLNLQELAGKSGTDSPLREAVSSELNRLLQLRSSTFSKDTPWTNFESKYHHRALNIARNFMFLVPELGEYLNQNALQQVQEAVAEYNFVGPYWFVSRYNAMVSEGSMQPLYDYNAIFQAKAYILKEPREQLTKYLDAPAFERGDLFYIQNLVAAIEAGPH